MNKILIITLMVFGLYGCKNNDTNEIIDQLIKDSKNFTYKKVEQGFFEEIFYSATDTNKVLLEFDILSTFSEGEWNPVNSLQLLDFSGEKVIHIKYVALDTSQYINVLIKFEDEKYFEEDFNLPAPIRTMTVAWQDREVQIRAEEFEYALSIPFDVDLIGSLVSSMEVINQIRTE